MSGRGRPWALVVAAVLAVGGAPSAMEGGAPPVEVGTSFPADFPTPVDHSLGVPVIGFGAAGPIARTPVILLHGNNDTPYPTDCNGAMGHAHAFATYLVNNGWQPSEVWALGYQGDQCDTLVDPTVKSSEAHTAAANVPDLRAFVSAVLGYTGADRVDIIGHSLGGIVPREWMRQDDAHHLVRRLVMVDSPHAGIINCSPSTENYFALGPMGGFHPDSAICREFGAPDTELLSALAADPVPGPTQYLSIRNADTSFVYFANRDGAFPPVPAEDRHGSPQDFSRGAYLPGALNVDVFGQGAWDPALGTAHIGISNSPEVWELAARFLDEGPDAF